MATENDLSFGNESVSPEESASNKSFVKKVTSRVSGFLPSSLSKWFVSTESPTVRPRDETDDDDETLRIQPPAKRAKASDSTTVSSVHNNHHARHLFVAPRAEIDRTKNNVNCVKFLEPVAGPSGYSSVGKRSASTTKASLNANTCTPKTGEVRNCDNNSDSGESTSGYSSMRVGSKEQVAESTEQVKQKPVTSPEKCKTLFNTPSKLDRSLFNDRTSSPHMNTSLSTRQPSFNSSAFGSPNFVDRTLSSKRILDSPFYSGRTTYGGASAYGRRLAKRSHDSSAIVRNTIQIKPVNEKKSESASLSKTARRILDTLEQYTAPTADAKKIPNPPKKAARYAHVNPYAIRETKVPSNRELQVPTVPDLLKMKLKEKMQNTTVSVRRIANSSKCSLNTEEYKIATLDEDNNIGKRSNKIKNKISSVRERPKMTTETVEEVKLPDVQLPITSLPVFNFAIPAPSSSNISKPVEIISSTTTTVKTTEKISVGRTEKNIELKKTEEVVKETLRKDNNRTEQNTSKSEKSDRVKQTEYIFSDPTVLSENDVDKWECKVCLVRNKIGESKCAGCTTPLTTINGTMEHSQKYTYTFADPVPVDDNKKNKPTIKNDLSQFKMSADKWECSTCLVRNNSTDLKCIACTTPKVTNGSIIPQPVTTNAPKSFSQFKPPTDTWECSVCMIRNKNDRKTCEACTSPKPTPKQENGILEKNDTTPASGFDKFKSASDTPKYPSLNLFNKSNSIPEKTEGKQSVFKSNLMDKFKPDSDTWECSACMVSNKNSVTSCVACTTPKKENGFGDQFKRKNDQWECASCMVRNSEEKLKCVCCDAAKPGSNPQANVPKETKPVASFNFGIVNNEAVGQMFSFGVKPIDSTPAKPVVGSIFGQQSGQQPATTPKFVFGVNATETKKETPESTSNKTDNAEEKKVSVPDTSKSATPQETTPKPASSVKPTLNGDVNKTPLLFGNNAAKPPEAKSTFMFGASQKPAEPTEIKPPPSVSQPFVFGVTSTPSTSLFTTTTTTASTVPTLTANPTTSLAVFKFGNSTEKPSFGVQQTDKPTFGVQSTEKPTFGIQSTEKPTFGVPSVEKSTFGVREVAKPAFGVQPTEKPTFGAQEAAKPMFGAPSMQKPTFGIQPAEKPSLFGNATTPGPSKLSSNTASQPATGGFSFGSTPVNNPAAPAQNGTFSFGNPSSNTPKPTFNFGGQQTASPGVFNFGSTPSTSTAPSTSGGFNFSANADFQPNFNFTTGAPPSAFSAQPSGNSAPERRVIRRALRRTQR